MMTQRLARYLFTLFLLSGLSGCASWFSNDEPDPQVHLVQVEVVRAKLLEQKFILHFRVDNPNDSDLTVRSLEYRIHLGDMLLTEGEHEHWFTVGPKHSAYFKVPIRTNLWPKVRDLVKMLKKPDQPIPYRLEGELETGLFIAHYVHLARNGVIIPADLIPEKTR
ncbi:LEA14-like dessication related protein [Pseudomonas sp. JAI111]|uniref:LEA type 2 family protein n=1 Tax=unclassified Pseudomonas TaxID=196821 RepID=UPI001C99728C|nr:MULTISPECIES: LEA type 2 family protein [unclassified Pseudomonas]MCS3836671.1 LEA14-like dessication related protein [Pseudomonas sp. JAI111]QZP35621.1 LEA type 2 family protein [Pseudomonas sp. DR48]